MYRNILLFFLLSYCSSTSAQTGAIRVSVTTSGLPESAATVSLLHSSDSSWITSELTNDKGGVIFKELAAGSYLVSVTSVGFATALKALAVNGTGNTDCNIELQKQDASLKEVTVSARKPLIEMSMGKMTVNVEGSAIVSGNALDLLRRLPGVIVAPDGSISMSGKRGVLVLIDDRPTYLSGSDLADYLRSMTAAEISQMELITQPGAKYDAEGNVGIINFKRGRSKKSGLNGNASFQIGQGVYANGQGSVMLNYRKDKLNIMLTASDHEAKGFGDWTETQYLIDPATGTVSGTNHVHSTPWERYGIASTRVALDYTCTDHTTIGTSIRGTYHPNSSQGYIYSTNTNTAAGTTYNEVINPDGFIRKDASVNAYLTHKFTKENVLDINADYLSYGNYTRQDINSHYYDILLQPLPDPLILHGDQQTIINVLSLKADHSYTFHNGLKLESGPKSSFVTTDNNSVFSIFTNNTWINDPLRSNHFVYQENINAAYCSASKSFGKKWETKVGLRAEQTTAEGRQYMQGTPFTRNYISLFPTCIVNYKPDSNNTLELNYGRRIDRPPYRLLNPFISYSFQYSYQVGNPYLLPEYTHNIELKHSYKNWIISTIGFSKTDDVINSILVTDSAGKIHSTNRNMGTNNRLEGYVQYNKDVAKWWSMNALAYAAYLSLSGPVNGVNTTKSGIEYSFHLNSQVDLGKGWKAAVNGYYEYGTIISLIESYGAQLYMEYGLSKKIHDNMQMRVSVNDPFYVSRLQVYNNMDNFRSNALFRNATQMVVFEFNYSFGGNQAGTEKRNSLDESSRIK